MMKTRTNVIASKKDDVLYAIVQVAYEGRVEV